MKELAKTYNPAGIEDKLYQKWLDNKYFHADAARGKREGRKPFTIVTWATPWTTPCRTF